MNLSECPGAIKLTSTPETARLLLSAYRSRVIFADESAGSFGKGALGISRWTITFGGRKEDRLCILAGDYTETAQDCRFLAGGEHNHSHVINTSPLLFPFVTSIEEAGSITSKGPIVIGSNVTISTDVTVLSGVTIGHGAVIGAGTMVTKDVPPFAIVAGNPARIIRYRFDEKTIEALLELRWWDFNVDALAKHIKDIQDIPTQGLGRLAKVDDSVYVDDTKSCSIVFRQDQNKNAGFIGAQIDERFIPKEQLPDIFRQYMNQLGAKPGTEIYYVPNIFKASGLA